MSFDYASLASVATELIAEFGRSDITQRNFPEGTYDTSTGTVTRTPTDTTRTGVKLNFGSGQTTVRGKAVKAGDFRLLIDGSASVDLQDVFVIDGVIYTIVSMDETNPAGTRLIQDLHIQS